MPPTTHSASITEGISATDTMTAAVRSNLSVTHILSAAMFSRAAGAIETANAEKAFGDFWEDIQANAIATILTSVAALEGYANELFVDHAEVFPELRLDIMTKLWELYEQKPILEKYDFALLLRQGSAFDRGAPPHQDIAALIKLRNALVHYKPEWSNEQVEHAKVSNALKNRAVKSSYFSTNDSLFPRAWVSHGTTCWAVKSVISYIYDFEQRASLKSRLAPFIDRLNLL
jgi:hypothetical protein